MPAVWSAEVRVEMERVIHYYSGNEHVVVFREVEGSRRLCLMIGYCEVWAVLLAISREPWPRPLTHRAWADTIAGLGAVVESVCIVARRGTTYFAEIRLLRDQMQVKLDVRPSDALVIALLAGVPLRFTEGLLSADAVSQQEPA